MGRVEVVIAGVVSPAAQGRRSCAEAAKPVAGGGGEWTRIVSAAVSAAGSDARYVLYLIAVSV